MKPATIRVWDLPTRLFHWLLVSLVVGAVVTVKLGGNAMLWHGRIGIAMIALLAFRLAWGVVGSTYARFAEFLRGPSEVRAYLRGEWVGHGHNPVGALSVVAMLGVLGFQAVSGLAANDDIAFNGPLYALVSKDLSDWVTGLHRQAELAILALIALHLGAIAYYQRVKKQDLLRPMITGTVHSTDPDARSAQGGGPLALVAALALALLLAWIAAGGLLPPPPPPPPPPAW